MHPEELREHRRKLLTIERNGLQAQLDLLKEERVRIEAAIAAAATPASLEYPQPSPSPLQVTTPAEPITEMVSLRDLSIAEFPVQTLCRSLDVSSAWQRIHLAFYRCNTEGPAVEECVIPAKKETSVEIRSMRDVL